MNLNTPYLHLKAVAVAVSILSFLPVTVQADSGYFVEATAGKGDVVFKPSYRFLDGSAPSSFRNEEQGTVLGLGVGYLKQMNDQFSVSLSGHLTYQKAEWTLYLPWEPASFSYEIPYTFGLTLSPSWHPNDQWRLFAELGVISGQVKERKASTATSYYDADEWAAGVLLGAGVGYKINDQLELTLSYRDLKYNDIDYQTFLPDGSQRAAVSDSPRSNYTALGLRYRF